MHRAGAGWGSRGGLPEAMSVERVGVLGCGLMGSGISEVAARAGYDVHVLELDDLALEEGRKRVARSLERAVEREKISALDRDRALERLFYTTNLAELRDRDLIIEAVVESLEVKNQLFRELDALCQDHTILASNTSSLSITDLAAVVGRPDRVIGLHFFNPVPVMRLVEIVRTMATSESTLELATALIRRLGKETVTALDSSGFVVNRLLVPFMLDAIRLLEARGRLRRGTGQVPWPSDAVHPMGPLTLCDFIGNDTVHRIAEIMYAEYRNERFVPPPLLKRLVAMGRYGRKSGAGFYEYSGSEPVAIVL